MASESAEPSSFRPGPLTQGEKDHYAMAKSRGSSVRALKQAALRAPDDHASSRCAVQDGNEASPSGLDRLSIGGNKLGNGGKARRILRIPWDS